MKRFQTMHRVSIAAKAVILPLLLVWNVHPARTCRQVNVLPIQGESGVESSALPAATITIPPALEIRDHREAVVETILQEKAAPKQLNERGIASETARFSLFTTLDPQSHCRAVALADTLPSRPKAGKYEEYTTFEVLTPGGSIDIQLKVEQSAIVCRFATTRILGSGRGAHNRPVLPPNGWM